MPTKLDFNIGRSTRNALITWAIGDVAEFVIKTWEQVSNLIIPSARVSYENTLQLVRKPIQTTFSWANWKKALKTLPFVGSDITMKALRLPFATLDNAVTHLVNDNLERAVDLGKAATTRLAANIVCNKWQTKFEPLNKIANVIEWFWDAVWSIIKAPTGLVAKVTGWIDNYLARWTTKTDGLVNSLRISDADFIPRQHYDGVTNSWSRPEVANDNKVVSANDNHILWKSKAA